MQLQLLARRLQELEVHDGMSLEERDRLLAIEAQDKELAKMLQERVSQTINHLIKTLSNLVLKLP